MQKILLYFLLILFFISCKKETGEISQHENALTSDVDAQQILGSIVATKAHYFDSVFTRYGGGWTGGDVAYSYRLPDGRSFWLWGDTFLDTVYPDRSRPIVGFIHNSIVLTDSTGGFVTVHGGTEKNPKAFFNAKEPKQYWTNCAFTDKSQDRIFVLMAIIKATGEGGLFGFKFSGNSVGVLGLPGLQKLKVVDFSKDTLIDWSSATLEEDDYVYIYGAESTQFNKFMHVCRTSRVRPFEKVEFYNGTGWVVDPSKSERLQGGVSEQYSVFKYKGRYYLLSQQSTLFSDDIFLWDAAGPVGPFTNKRKVYTTPQTGGNIITYNATAHTEFIKDGKLLIGYCTNSLRSLDIYHNADNYRPYFVWLSNWQ